MENIKKKKVIERMIKDNFFVFLIFFGLFLIFCINFSNAGTTHGVLGKVLDACDGTKADGANVTFYILTRPNEILYDVVGPSGNSGTSNWYFVDVGNFPTPWQPGETLVIDIVKDTTHYIYNITINLSNAGFDIVPTVRLPGGVCFRNYPPEIIDFWPKENLTINQAITLWIYAIDRDNDTLTVEWYVDGEMVASEYGEQPINSSFVFSNGLGSHIVSVVVSDQEYNVSLEWEINVINNPPQLFCFPEPGYIETNTTIIFYANATDIDNDILTLTWFVDDQQVKTKQDTNVSDSFEFSSNVGLYSIKAVVTDGLNNKSCEWQVKLINATCVDYWKCGNWSDCDEYGKKHRECYKLNPECQSNVNMPAIEMYDPSCFINCTTEWVCGNWSECIAKYSLEDFIDKEPPYYVKGQMFLECHDIKNCTSLKRIHVKNCTLLVPIKVETKKECEVAFIYITDLKTNKTLAKIKRPFGFTGVDVYILPSEKERYCWYCFNGVKDFDEVGVDCGGPHCPPCGLKEYLPRKKPNMFKIIILTLFILTLILFIVSKIKELRENISPIIIFERTIRMKKEK